MAKYGNFLIENQCEMPVISCQKPIADWYNLLIQATWGPEAGNQDSDKRIALKAHVVWRALLER